MRRWIRALLLMVVGFSLGLNGTAATKAVTEEEAFFLCLGEGNPGTPGDGVVVSSIGGGNDFFFDVRPQFPLLGITDGLTVSAFPPSGVLLADLMIQVNFSVVGRSPEQCSVGTAAQHIKITVNGVEGRAQNFSQERLNFLVNLVRDHPACADVTLDEFLLDQIALVNSRTGAFFQQIDALAVGIGENAFPTETTPSLCLDTTPPTITVAATPATLWPPNGKMVPVTVSGTMTDAGSGVNVNTATYAVIDEYGSVQPSGMITLGATGSYTFTIQLQASRNGNDKDGRQYTITVSVTNNAGNKGSAATGVLVLHDQGH